MHDYNQLLIKQREKFIADRSMQEQQFNKWKLKAVTWKPELKARLSFDVDSLTLQQLVPSWYSETPNKEQEAIELANANKLLEEANRIADEYNAKAAGLVEQFDGIGGT